MPLKFYLKKGQYEIEIGEVSEKFDIKGITVNATVNGGGIM